jgi:hypothetical protein
LKELLDLPTALVVLYREGHLGFRWPEKRHAAKTTSSKIESNISLAPAGKGAAHNVIQPSVVFNYLIKS